MNRIPKLLACLNVLGLDKLDSFVVRKKIQNIVYLLQEFGLDLGYKFNWYLHGPCSADLTQTIVGLSELKEKNVSE